MPKQYLSNTVNTINGGTLYTSAQNRHDTLMMEFRHWPGEHDRMGVSVQFGLKSSEARRLYHLLDRIYNPAYDEEKTDA